MSSYLPFKLSRCYNNACEVVYSIDDGNEVVNIWLVMVFKWLKFILYECAWNCIDDFDARGYVSYLWFLSPTVKIITIVLAFNLPSNASSLNGALTLRNLFFDFTLALREHADFSSFFSNAVRPSLSVFDSPKMSLMKCGVGWAGGLEYKWACHVSWNSSFIV